MDPPLAPTRRGSRAPAADLRAASPETSINPNTRRAYSGALRCLDAWLDAGRSRTPPSPPFSPSFTRGPVAGEHLDGFRPLGSESEAVAIKHGRLAAVLAGLLFMVGDAPERGERAGPTSTTRSTATGEGAREIPQEHVHRRSGDFVAEDQDTVSRRAPSGGCAGADGRSARPASGTRSPPRPSDDVALVVNALLPGSRRRAPFGSAKGRRTWSSWTSETISAAEADLELIRRDKVALLGGEPDRFRDGVRLGGRELGVGVRIEHAPPLSPKLTSRQWTQLPGARRPSCGVFGRTKGPRRRRAQRCLVRSDAVRSMAAGRLRGRRRRAGAVGWQRDVSPVWDRGRRRGGTPGPPLAPLPAELVASRGVGWLTASEGPRLSTNRGCSSTRRRGAAGRARPFGRWSSRGGRIVLTRGVRH